MAKRPPRILGWRLVLVGVVVGVVLSVSSVPVCAWLRPWAAGEFWLVESDAYWIRGDGHAAITVLEASTPGYRTWWLLYDGETRATEFPASARAGPDARLRADPRPAKIRREGDGIMSLDDFVAAGWPRPCACGRGIFDGTPGWTRSEGGLLRVGVGVWDRPIPLRPLWFGLASNTILYACLTIALVVLVRVWRRRRRRWRNRCIACGYDLSQNAGPCPECGTLDPKRAN